MRLIDADNLISVLDILSDKGDDIRYWEQLKLIVADCPTADVAEVKHGRWTGINKNKYNDDEATCSICGVTFSSGYSDPSWWDYCPNCGSRMDL